METLSIQTSQNIAIEHPIASVAERMVATLIDFALYLGYMAIISIVGGIGGDPVIIGILMIPLSFYHLFMEQFMDGQSIGKRVLKIKVVKIDGSEASFASYFIRWIFRIVDVLLLGGGIATLTIILNGKGQRIGDLAANTTVIRLKKQSVNNTLFMKLPADYSIQYPEAEKLSASDLYTIKEVLNYLKKSGRSIEARNTSNKASKAIQKKMGISVTSGSEKFLFTVLRDYNSIQQRKSS